MDPAPSGQVTGTLASVRAGKRCSKCSTVKELDAFHADRRRVNGRASMCKGCKSEYMKSYWANEKNPHKSRSYRLQAYGITTADYERMFVEQEGVCAICASAPNGRNLCVDHSHESGKVRQLLCVQCNAGLGQFAENPERMLSAINYLKRHNEGAK